MYVGEGLGHVFMALTETRFSYLCSEGYAPGREHGVHPLDPEIGIEWPADITPLLSPKDAAAPTLAQARGGRAAAVVRRVPGVLPQPAHLTGAASGGAAP